MMSELERKVGGKGDEDGMENGKKANCRLR